MFEHPTPLLSLRTNRYRDLYRFYVALLGPPTKEKAEAWAYFPSLKLYLWSSAEPVSRGTALQLCLHVDLLEAALPLLPESSEPGPIRVASHGRELSFWDPDGNELLLYEPMLGGGTHAMP